MRNFNLALLRLALAAMLVLSVAACGGGGGGGGGGVSGAAWKPDQKAIAGSPVKGTATKEQVVPTQLAAAIQSGQLSGEGSDGIGISADGKNLILGEIEVPIADFKVHENGLVSLVDEQGMVVLGSQHETMAVVGSGLTFSNFGYWFTAANITDAGNGKVHLSRDAEGGLLAFGSTPNKVDIGTSGTFKGGALGFVWEDTEKDKKGTGTNIVPLVGTATLAMNAANSGTLTLDFSQSQFYKLTANIDQSSASGFSGRFTKIEGNNNTGITLPTTVSAYDGNSGQGTYVNGAAFGPSGTASEAVGTFGLEKIIGNKESGYDHTVSKGVEGAFGVKKQ